MNAQDGRVSRIVLVANLGLVGVPTAYSISDSVLITVVAAVTSGGMVLLAGEFRGRPPDGTDQPG